MRLPSRPPFTLAERIAHDRAGEVRDVCAVLGLDYRAGALAGAAVALGWLAALRLWGIE